MDIIKSAYQSILKNQSTPISIELLIKKTAILGYGETKTLNILNRIYSDEKYRYSVQFSRLPNWATESKPYFIRDKNFTHIVL